MGYKNGQKIKNLTFIIFSTVCNHLFYTESIVTLVLIVKGLWREQWKIQPFF